MYNERTRQPNSSHRQGMQGGCAIRRDIPIFERPESMQSRRKCDGTLRNSENGQMPQMPESPSTCTVGKCGGWGLQNHPLAMVYSPCQAWQNAYAPDVALSRGTLFAELDLPFEGGKNKRGCM